MRERKRIIEKQKTVLISRNFECSILLIIREIQFKTTKHYFTCLRLTKKKKGTIIPSVGKEAEKW